MTRGRFEQQGRHRHKPLRISGHPAPGRPAQPQPAALRHKPLRISGHPAPPGCPRAPGNAPATSLFESQGIRRLLGLGSPSPQTPPQASSNLRASGGRSARGCAPPPRPGRHKPLRISGHPAGLQEECEAAGQPPQASSNLRASGNLTVGKLRRARHRHKPLRISGHPALWGCRPGPTPGHRHKPLRISGHPARQ